MVLLVGFGAWWFSRTFGLLPDPNLTEDSAEARVSTDEEAPVRPIVERTPRSQSVSSLNPALPSTPDTVLLPATQGERRSPRPADSNPGSNPNIRAEEAGLSDAEPDVETTPMARLEEELSRETPDPTLLEELIRATCESGPSGQSAILSLLEESEGSDLTSMTVNALVAAGNQDLADPLLELAEQGHPDTYEILRGLARWDDGTVQDELIDRIFARQPSDEEAAEEQLSEVGARALGAGLLSDSLASLLNDRRESSGAAHQVLLLTALDGVADNPNVDADDLVVPASRVLDSALRSGEPDVWGRAMKLILRQEGFRTASLISRLQEIASEPEPSPRRRDALRTLAGIDR